MEKEQPSAVKRLPSRPSALTPELADMICSGIAQGQTLMAIGLAEGFDAAQVSRWRKRYDWFDKAYAHAREVQLDVMAEEIIPLSDEAQGKDSAGVAAIKLRTDNRKWMLSKLRASVFGDRLDVTSKGEALAAPSHQVDARVQSIVMQAAMRMAGEEGELALPPAAADLLG